MLGWLGTVEEEQTFLSVVSLGEMRKGCELLEPGSKRRIQLERWLEYDWVEVRAELMVRARDAATLIDFPLPTLASLQN